MFQDKVESLKSTEISSPGMILLFYSLRGRGGVNDLGKVRIEFSVVSDRGECQLPDAFYPLPDQKILILAEVIGFWNLENTGKTRFAKNGLFRSLKSIYSYKFWNRPLKLGSYVLGVKTQIINRAEFWFRPLKSKY